MAQYILGVFYPLQLISTNTNPPNLYPAAAPLPNLHNFPTNQQPSAVPFQMNHLPHNMCPPNPPPPAVPGPQLPPANLSEGSGSSSTAARRRRGRPLGSKNKPKVADQRRDDYSTKQVNVEVPPGVDLIQWLLHFARANNVAVTLLGGYGMVSRVVLGNGSLEPIYGIMTMTSISGTYLPAFPLALAQAHPSSTTSFFSTATFSNTNGTVFVGPVISIITHAPVVICASLAKTVDIILGG